MTEEDELTLRDYISMKNYFGAEEFLLSIGVNKEQANIVLKATDAFGNVEFLEEAKALVHNERSLQAIVNLQNLYEALDAYDVTKYVSFDLSMVSKYNYYTGVIFKGYTYGVGDAVLTGGRYDKLLSYFGKEAPAIGFMITIDELMIALTSQKIEISIQNDVTLMLYSQDKAKEAIKAATTMRREGKKVELVCKQADKTMEEYEAYAKNNRVYEIDKRYL